MTKVNGGCLQEGVIGIVELFQGFITEACRDTAAESPVVRYILQKHSADAVTWQTVAGRGVFKHTKPSSQNTSIH